MGNFPQMIFQNIGSDDGRNLKQLLFTLANYVGQRRSKVIKFDLCLRCGNSK